MWFLQKKNRIASRGECHFSLLYVVRDCMLLVYHECWEEILFREDWECWRFIGPKCGSYFSWSSVLIKSYATSMKWLERYHNYFVALTCLAFGWAGTYKTFARYLTRCLLDICCCCKLWSRGLLPFRISGYVDPFSVWIQPWGHIYPLALPIQALYFKGYPRIALWLAVGGDDHVTPGLIILSHLDTTFLEVDVNHYYLTRVKDLFFIITSISPPPLKIAPCACTPQGWRVLTVEQQLLFSLAALITFFSLVAF